HQWMGNIHLLEASAGIVQLDIIHDLFGNRGVFLFDLHVNNGGSARKYMWLINDFAELAAARVKVTEKVGGAMAYLLWAALHANRQASPETGADKVSPVTYFHALADYVTRHCRGDVEIDRIRVLSDEFNAAWGFRPVMEAVRLNRDRARDASRKFAERWQQLQ